MLQCQETVCDASGFAALSGYVYYTIEVYCLYMWGVHWRMTPAQRLNIFGFDTECVECQRDILNWRNLCTFYTKKRFITHVWWNAAAQYKIFAYNVNN